MTTKDDYDIFSHLDGYKHTKYKYKHTEMSLYNRMECRG